MRLPRRSISAWFCSSSFTRSTGAAPVFATTAAAPPIAKSAAAALAGGIPTNRRLPLPSPAAADGIVDGGFGGESTLVVRFGGRSLLVVTRGRERREGGREGVERWRCSVECVAFSREGPRSFHVLEPTPSFPYF